MLSKCANALCNTSFRRLSDGKLFLLQGDTRTGETFNPGKGKPPRRLEYFWLCADCARLVTLTFTSTTGVTTVPLRGTTLAPARASAHATAGRQTDAGMLAHAGG